MDRSLDGARLKLTRAQEHLDSLKSGIETYTNSSPFELSHTVDAGTTHATVRISSHVPIRLSAIVGDCVNNARAALDYIAWELYMRAPHRDHVKPNRVSFPICEDCNAKSYVEAIDRFVKVGIHTQAIDEMKRSQPFNSVYEPLAWLHRLVNIDKHQTPLLTVGLIGAVDVLSGGFIQLQSEGYFDAAYRQQHRIDSKAAKDSVAFSTAFEVNAQPEIVIALKDPTMPSGPVANALDRIIRCVERTVSQFDPLLS